MKKRMFIWRVQFPFKMFGFSDSLFINLSRRQIFANQPSDLWSCDNIGGFSEMCHGSEICNSDIKQTTFAVIVENLKGQNVKL